MNGTNIITRFVAYLPDDSEQGREELARTTNLVSDFGFELLQQNTYLLAVTAPPSLTLARPVDMLLDVFPGTAASTRLAAASLNDAKSVEEVHYKAEASAQCYNLLQMKDTSFLLESDALGLKPVHIARTAGGNVLGSRISDLLCLFPTLAEPTDVVALYELLGFWAPLNGRTLHQRIRRTLPGGRYHWTSAAGLSGTRNRDLRPTTVEPLRFMDQAIEIIRDTASQSLLEKTKGAPEPIILALSGGFDSRLIAALCRDQHIHMRALSHGRRQNSETRSARAIARALGLELQTVPHLKDGTLRYPSQYLEATEGTTDPAAASIMNLFNTPSEPGNAVLHGFCGDAQAGSHISQFSAADYASRESMAAAVTRHYYAPHRPDLFGLFSPAPSPDDIRQDVLAGLRTDCPPYQAYLLWYLENRSRRHVASQIAILGEHFDPIMPFYDRRLFDIWHSIPPIGLMNRVVFKNLIAHYYPKLARIPHPEEAAPITPNLRWQLTRFYHRIPQHLLAVCLGSERAQEVFLRLYRHENIYKLSKLAAPQQRAYMLSQLTQLRPALKEGWGVELSQNYMATLSGDLQALRVMFMVARYAQIRRQGHS